MSKFLDNTGLQHFWGKIKSWCNTQFLKSSGGSMTGNIAMGGNKLTGLGTPTSTTDAATKQYVDEKTSGSSGSSLKLIAKYVTTGSHTWSCPKTADYLAVIIGGGGGGSGAEGSYNANYAVGGASGYVNYFVGNITQGSSISVKVGAGGSAAKNEKNGGNGGSSSFNGVVANGGEGGIFRDYKDDELVRGAKGGQCSTKNLGPYNVEDDPLHTNQEPWMTSPPYGGVSVITAYFSNASFRYPIFSSPTQWYPFPDENGLPISMLCAGPNPHQTDIPPLPNGKSFSKFATSSHGYGTPSTDVGGGGAAGPNREYYSAAGAPGGVFIYELPNS